jgi:hypothetical protein
MIFRLARAADDAQLRALMRDTMVPGHMTIVYAREPDFFEAYREGNDPTQVIVADDHGRIAGVGCRSIRNVLVGGTPASVGYLSGLRVRPSSQNGTTLARGYAYLKTLHADGRVPAYLSTIIQGNHKAKAMLTSGRAGLPAYIPLGNYLTHVCLVKRSAVCPPVPGELRIGAATAIAPGALTAFLLGEGRRRQFFPVCKVNGRTGGILRAIGLDNMLVAQRQGEIVGTMAVWDRSRCKQHIVAGYSRVGEALRYGTAAVICIRDDDRAVFQALLRQALVLAAARGLHQLGVGMHEDDPLVPALRHCPHVVYASWLYLVCWEGSGFYDALDNTRIPYLELGTL